VNADIAAVDQARPDREMVQGRDDRGVAVRPLVRVSREKPDASRISPRHQPEAVVLDLVNPVRSRRRLLGAGRGGMARYAMDPNSR
jgi:hypothetical protein